MKKEKCPEIRVYGGPCDFYEKVVEKYNVPLVNADAKADPNDCKSPCPMPYICPVRPVMPEKEAEGIEGNTKNDPNVSENAQATQGASTSNGNNIRTTALVTESAAGSKKIAADPNTQNPPMYEEGGEEDEGEGEGEEECGNIKVKRIDIKDSFCECTNCSNYYTQKLAECEPVLTRSEENMLGCQEFFCRAPQREKFEKSVHRVGELQEHEDGIVVLLLRQ